MVVMGEQDQQVQLLELQLLTQVEAVAVVITKQQVEQVVQAVVVMEQVHQQQHKMVQQI